GEQGMVAGQAYARVKGQLGSFKEALSVGYEVFATEKMPAQWMTKFPDVRERQLNGSDMAWMVGLSREGAAAKFLDKVGALATLNLRSLKAVDSISKVA